MYLRFFSRLQLVVAFVVACGMSYVVWRQSSTLEYAFTRTWTGHSCIVVTFGDTLGNFEEAKASEVSRTNSTGERHFVPWPEVLRQKIKYDVVQNNAHSMTGLPAATGFGVLTDNDIYINTTLHNDTSPPLQPDFRQQVQDWVKNFRRVTSARNACKYVFAISIGFWDVWEYSTLDLEDAKTAILASVQSLFEQLNLLDTVTNRNLTIILTALWDASFSPRFISRSLPQNSLQPRRYSELQHKLVYLMQYWNLALSQHAAYWQGNDLYIPDWNAWLLDQIRFTQMRKVGIFDAEGLGAGEPVFKDVSNPCSRTVLTSGASNAVPSRCASPRQYLWWDDVHFGPLAHELLGEMVANMVATNKTANAGATVQPSTIDTNPTPGFAPHLVPSLAPGN